LDIPHLNITCSSSPSLFPALSNIERQSIPTWPKMHAIPSFRKPVNKSGEQSPHIESGEQGYELKKRKYEK
jgi:hypothetical protein